MTLPHQIRWSHVTKKVIVPTVNCVPRRLAVYNRRHFPHGSSMSNDESVLIVTVFPLIQSTKISLFPLGVGFNERIRGPVKVDQLKSSGGNCIGPHYTLVSCTSHHSSLFLFSFFESLVDFRFLWDQIVMLPIVFLFHCRDFLLYHFIYFSTPLW